MILTDVGPTGDVLAMHAITAEPTVLHVDATLTEWRASGAGHPNCRCVLVPGLPGGPDPTRYSTWDKQKEQDREKLRELERDVRQAKRDGDEARIGEAQAELRRHVRETGITRRGYREQLPFADGGDLNPRGIRVPDRFTIRRDLIEHITVGDEIIDKRGRVRRSGGHMHGSTVPGKSHFPESWDRQTIVRALEQALAEADLPMVVMRHSIPVSVNGVDTLVGVHRVRDGRLRVKTFFPAVDHCNPKTPFCRH